VAALRSRHPDSNRRLSLISVPHFHLDVVHAGEDTFSLGPGLRELAFRRLLDDLSPLR
jgi:hypothetical protein